MKVVIQKVKNASVHVENKIYSSIESGICIFLGIEKNDSEENMNKMISQILKVNLFEGEKTFFEKSVIESNKEILIVSQFTLFAKFKSGKPSFSSAKNPGDAKILYEKFISEIKSQHSKVVTGKFGAHMQVELVNDGPVTFILES